MDEVGLPVDSDERPMLRSDKKPKLSKVHDLSSESESDLQSVYEDDRRTPTPENASDDDYLVRNDIFKNHKLPDLPATATTEQHASDLRACALKNAPSGQYGHKYNWNDISQEYRAKVAHARLIDGVYGVISPVTCNRCIGNGTKCRVYHPDLVRTGRLATVPGPWSECRLMSNVCTMDGRGHAKRDNPPSPIRNVTHPERHRGAKAHGESTNKVSPITGCDYRTAHSGKCRRHAACAHGKRRTPVQQRVKIKVESQKS